MNKDEWENAYKHAERHFKDHAATLIQDTDRFTIIDWRNKNGSSKYYINFIVDKKRGSLIVSGDLGDSIAVWYNPVEVSDLKKYIYKDIPYYMSKFQCTSDGIVYVENDVIEELIDGLFGTEDDREENIETYIAASYFDSFDDFKEEIAEEVQKSIHNRDFHPTDRLFELATDVYPDAWELFNGCGAKIDGRVYLWAIAFNMACNQLGL